MNRDRRMGANAWGPYGVIQVGFGHRGWHRPGRLPGMVALLVAGLLMSWCDIAVAQSPPADPCANPAACCVNPATCVITDRQTLAGLTVDSVVPAGFRLATYVSGGSGTQLSPAGFPGNLCGLSWSPINIPFAEALNTLDHRALGSSTIPKVVDFASPVNNVIVFVSVDHGPFPEEGIESTVWGSDSPDISIFPNGWTLATLTTIWKRGWEDPVQCQGQDNADDFVGQYSFLGQGFRYVAVHANFSISIFDDPSHTSWQTFIDDSGVPGWQSSEDEIDAIGTTLDTPACTSTTVFADAGPDQVGIIGQDVCFSGSGVSATGDIATMGWDLDGDGAIDVNGSVACMSCAAASSGVATFFVTDTNGCVASDTARFVCTTNPCQPADDTPPTVIDLSTWNPVQYFCQPSSDGAANWVITDNNTKATQTRNSDPAILGIVKE